MQWKLIDLIFPSVYRNFGFFAFFREESIGRIQSLFESITLTVTISKQDLIFTLTLNKNPSPSIFYTALYHSFQTVPEFAPGKDRALNPLARQFLLESLVEDNDEPNRKNRKSPKTTGAFPIGVARWSYYSSHKDASAPNEPDPFSTAIGLLPYFLLTLRIS